MEPGAAAAGVTARCERRFVRLDGDPLHTPESTVPPCTMRAFGVVPALQGVVSDIVGYRETLVQPITERVLPDGALCLIMNLADVPGEVDQPGAALAAVGARAAPALVRLQGRVDGYSIRLRPGAAARILGVPAGELVGRAVPLGDLWPQAPALLDRLRETAGDAARIAVLQAALVQRLARSGGPAGPLALPAALASARSPREVAAVLGLGERRLQQLFHQQVGLPPRTWARLMRLQACLRLLRRPGPPRWADVALAAGFYDQAHLVNEFQSLVGLTPTAFAGSGVAGSSKT